jgi:hypothetical protein
MPNAIQHSPNCTDGAGPIHQAMIVLANAKRHSYTMQMLNAMHYATIALANAKCHSTFAVLVRTIAPTVQGR